MRNNYWHSELPVGDPFGGVPYGEYNDPGTMSGASAGVGAAASVGGGLFGKSSAKKAAKIQSGAAQKASDAMTASTNAANTVLGDAYREQSSALMPWLNAGGNALNELAWGFGQNPSQFDPNAQLGPRKTEADYRTELVDSFTTKAQRNKYGDIKANQSDKVDEAGLKAAIAKRIAEDDARYSTAGQQAYQGQGEQGGFLRNFGMQDFQEDPGYQFALDQGQRGIQGSAAAGGSLLSGATLKALTRFNQDTANNQFQNSFDRFNQNKTQNMNALFNLSGIGQQSAGQIGAYNMNANNNIANNLNTLGMAKGGLLQQAGNAQASGVMGGANALMQGIGGAVNQLGSFNAMNTLKGMGTAGQAGLTNMALNQTRQSGYAAPFNMNIG